MTPPPGIGTADDAVADIAATILDAALCWRCIKAKTGLALGALDEAMLALRSKVRIALSLAPCEGCQCHTLRYRIDSAEPADLNAILPPLR